MRRTDVQERARFVHVVGVDVKTGFLTGSEGDRLLRLCDDAHTLAYLWEQRGKIVWPRRLDLLFRYAIFVGLIGFFLVLPWALRRLG
jgi:hypothetical protein